MASRRNLVTAVLGGGAAAALLLTLLPRDGAQQRDSCAAAQRAYQSRDAVGRERACYDPESAEGPEPIFVVAAGPPRSGTTWLYNALRLLMQERDPNTVAGWHMDLRHAVDLYPAPRTAVTAACEARPRPVEALRSTGASVLVKVHKYPDWDNFTGGVGPNGVFGAPSVDLVFTAVRDLSEMVRSLRLAGNWSRVVSDEEMSGSEFCRKWVDPRLGGSRPFTKDDWESPGKWVHLAKQHAICADRLRDRVSPSADGGVLQYSSIAKEPWKDILRRLAEALGRHRGWVFTDDDLARIAGRLRLLRAPPCDGHMELNPASHLHRGHVHKHGAKGDSISGQDVEARCMAAVREDAFLSSWTQRHIEP